MAMMQDLSGPALDRDALCRRGLRAPPFNLDTLLADAACVWHDRVWVADRETSLDYREADHLASRMAATLIAGGVVPGDRVAVLIPNHPAFVVAMWGAWRAGAICSAMHVAYAEPTLAAQIADCAPACLITLDSPAMLARAERLAAASGMRIVALPERGSLHCAALVPDTAQPRRAEPQSIALLQYTGGTTGGVKAAMLTHAGITINIGQLCAVLPRLARGAETMLAVAPFAHITGLQLLCQGAYLGARVLLENRFDPDRTAQLCLDEKVSFFTCVPTVMEGLTRSAVARAGDWSALKYVIAGGAPLPAATRDRFEAMTGCELAGGYGLSEASPAVLVGFRDDEASSDSIGPPLPDTRIAISAADDPNRFLAPGETGEIRIAGPQVMQGYWRQPDESAMALEHGMLRTGDIGHIDRTGRVHVSGRLKDLIIAGGYNIYPSRVEDAIFTHDAVADVAVIGVPHDYRGETVKAVIVTKPGRTLALEELQAWLAPKLSPMEMPKLLEVRTSLPKSPAGKTLKIALRDDHVAA